MSSRKYRKCRYDVRVKGSRHYMIKGVSLQVAEHMLQQSGLNLVIEKSKP